MQNGANNRMYSGFAVRAEAWKVLRTVSGTQQAPTIVIIVTELSVGVKVCFSNLSHWYVKVNMENIVLSFTKIASLTKFPNMS